MIKSWMIRIGCSCLIIFPFTLYSLTLPNAVQYAVNNMPDTNIKIAQHNAAAQTIKQAKAGYLPSLDVTGGYGREHAENPVAATVDGSKESTLTRSEFGTDLTENIFDGFNTTNEVKRTKNETLAAKYEVLGESNNLSLNITEQYLNVLLQQKLLRLAEQNVVAHRNIAKMISDRKQAGVSRESEVTQAQSRIALAQSNVISQDASLKDAKTKFERFVKLRPINLSMPRVPKFPNIPKTMNSALNEAYASHPTLKSAKADVNAAVAQHKASKFTNYPKLDLVLEADRNRNIDGIKGPNNNYIAMMRASYNLFKGGAHVAKQQETAYQVSEAREIRNRTILQVKEAVNLAWTAMESQSQRVIRLREYNRNAVKTLAAYKEEFKLNKRSLLDVLDSQNEVFQSSVEYQTALFDEMFARFRLLNAMGVLNQFLHVRVIIRSKPDSSLS